MIRPLLSLNAIPSDVHWAQFYAIFILDQYRGQAAIDYYKQTGNLTPDGKIS
ncbi:MAG: hypothetical protein ACLTY7_01060 [Clostridium fessum]